MLTIDFEVRPGGTALCYERLSYSYNKNDTPPEKQRKNNLFICESLELVAEIYADIDGHRSGTDVVNRPEWLKLEKRLDDPDVTALVANDLARIHRKGWRIGQLLEELDRREIALILSAPGRQIDTTTPQGRLFIQWMAAADQYYAEDIALRQRNSIAVRKARGVTVGIPPFGTVRNDRGHLIPSYEGAWLLSTGEWVDGHQAAPPEDAAVWRGYYDALLRALQLYATNRYGYGRLADKMQTEGWAFRGQDGQPVAFNSDRTRLIVSHVHTYGGIVQNAR
jgi:DNA invertase Pin-like site-specific DNA recombinase